MSTGNKQQSARLLALLVRVVAIVGSISAAFGPGYAWLLLHLLYGPRWSATAAPAALSLYSWFILLLAVSIVHGLARAFHSVLMLLRTP
jgi:Rft protein